MAGGVYAITSWFFILLLFVVFLSWFGLIVDEQLWVDMPPDVEEEEEGDGGERAKLVIFSHAFIADEQYIYGRVIRFSISTIFCFQK